MNPPDQDLHTALARFVGSFEHVFDHDWFHTKGCLATPDSFIDPQATFLAPAEFDEGNNWCSRAALLEAYRDLVEVMLRHGIQPDMDAGLTDP
jgi:hypothetical protein